MQRRGENNRGGTGGRKKILHLDVKIIYFPGFDCWLSSEKIGMFKGNFTWIVYNIFRITRERERAKKDTELILEHDKCSCHCQD